MEVLWKNFSSVKFQFPIVSFWPSISGNSRLNFGPVELLESCPEYFKIIYINIVNHGRVASDLRRWRTTIPIINYDNVISVIITIAHSKIFTNFDPIPALRHGAQTRRWLYWFQSREERRTTWSVFVLRRLMTWPGSNTIIRDGLQSSLQVKGRTLNSAIWPNHRLRHEISGLKSHTDLEKRRSFLWTLTMLVLETRGWCWVAKLPLCDDKSLVTNITADHRLVSRQHLPPSPEWAPSWPLLSS